MIGIGGITFISYICFLFIDTIGYHVVALILLLAVSVLAMFFEILPIVLVAILSAIIWNFFFIQPRYTFNISTPEDALLFSMYFVIAVMNAVFTSKIRRAENSARERKERARTIELYNTLLNSLSHELRTPISTIIGAVDTLKQNPVQLSTSNKVELYDEINIAGNRLNRQVSNLLHMSRLESDFINLQLDWYDIYEIIYSVIKNNQEESTGHNIVVKNNPDIPFFKLDGILVEQIIHNIVHNALRYTPEGSTIEIFAKHLNGQCVIEISDNGKGFPEDKLKFVFEKFYRLPNSAAGGTGLGLSIAKGFAQAHNGTIELKNRDSGGANFRICIPTEVTYLNSYDNE